MSFINCSFSVPRKGSPIVTNCYNLDLFYVGGYGYNIDNNKNGGWLATPTSKEAMDNIQVGQTITTQKSGIQGKVAEIIENKNGTLRVLLTLADGTPRWTTVK